MKDILCIYFSDENDIFNQNKFRLVSNGVKIVLPVYEKILW